VWLPGPFDPIRFQAGEVMRLEGEGAVRLVGDSGNSYVVFQHENGARVEIAKG